MVPGLWLLIPLKAQLGVQGRSATNLPSPSDWASNLMEEASQNNAPFLDDTSGGQVASANMISRLTAQSPGPLASPRTNLEHLHPAPRCAHLFVQLVSLPLTANIAVIL